MEGRVGYEAHLITLTDEQATNTECRAGCAACCIAPSISSPIPGMAAGKPAGVRCFQLTAEKRCLLFGRAERPPVCGSLRASEEMCGSSAVEALERLTGWEEVTRPETTSSYRLDSTP